MHIACLKFGETKKSFRKNYNQIAKTGFSLLFYSRRERQMTLFLFLSLSLPSHSRLYYYCYYYLLFSLYINIRSAIAMIVKPLISESSQRREPPIRDLIIIYNRLAVYNRE